MRNKNKNLILQEKQAYQGAKGFYTCFLCIVIIIVSALQLSYSLTQSALEIVILILSYILALKYYKDCYNIDTSLLQYSDSSNQIDMSITEVMSYQSQYCNGSPQASLGIDNHNNKHRDVQRMKEEQYITQQAKTEEDSHSNESHIYKNKNGTHKNMKSDKPSKVHCKFCKVVCPYRSRHCAKCQVCIERYDHHCFWIGNCVGYHNHRQFYLFLLLQTINNIAMLFSLSRLHFTLYNNGHATTTIDIIMYSLRVAAFGFLLFTAYLLLYHSMLILAGMTTWEHMARKKITYLNYLPIGYNPFSKGMVANIKQFWLGRKENNKWRQYEIPSYEQAKSIEVPCNLIDNKYYSCC